MTLRRRQSLVELAQKHDFIIFEDDAYSDLRYEGKAPPSLRALDETGRVIHMRSLSKIFCPGMRLAWVVADAAVISKMATAKQFVDTCTNSLAQYVLLEYIQRGLLDKKLQLILSHYCRKRDFMLSQLERHFPREVRWNRPEGGFFIWVHLPEHLDGSEVLREAIEQKVVFVPGSAFYIDGGGRNTIRLSFAQVDEPTIEVAIAELGKIIKRKLTQ
jgi:2-aminoadipate transaminase